MSMRFVTTRAEDLDANIDQALADLGKCVGADRVYFSLSGPPERLHAWRREGSDFPPDWPQQSLALAARFEATPDGIVHVFNVNRLPPGMNRELCVGYGLKGFGCIADADAEGGDVVLWLDCLRQRCPFTRSYEIGLLRMVRDILVTAVGRQMMEQERTRLAARLQRARRMETIGALTSGIAHNFNNIVGAILGYTEMAETHARASEPARYLGEIRRAGQRAQDLVDQILTFGRSRDARWRPVRVQDLLDESASLLRASLPRGIELEIRQVSATAVVRAEPSQLQQVILNLCNNAAQAMGETGRIEIDTHVHEVVRQRSLSHGEISRGRYICIAVSDTGRGIDEAILARIFDPFFTTRAAGNGLGLATVLEIVHEHGGAMNVHSARGSGSRFEAWLASIAEVDDTQNHDISALPLGYGDTVLIVSDQRAQLLREEEILAALGYEPVGFGAIDDALTACRRAPSRFDALVIAHAVSTQAALDLASAIRGIVPGLPILLATASAEEIDADALLVAGVTEVVGCPLVSGEIAAALARCLADRQVVALQA
jgi:signal transduction histidine kinase/CheY-like chemotaxis protein